MTTGSLNSTEEDVDVIRVAVHSEEPLGGFQEKQQDYGDNISFL